MTGILLAIALAVAAVNAQPALPAFEVVSVRPNQSGSPNSSSGRVAGNRYTATNVSLVSLLRVAYGLQEFQIDGQPRWADLDRFDIVATIPDSGRAEDWPLMVQTLLRDRFKLSASPTIFAAIQEQLGLRLDSTRGPVDILVVDSAETPSTD